MGAPKKLQEQQGYLAVEYVISLSLMITVVLTLFAMVNTAGMAAVSDELAAELHYSARSALLLIKSDVLGAQNLQVFNGGHLLRVETVAGEAVAYYVENHQLYRHGSAKLPVAEHAAAVSFRCVRPGLVEVIFEVGSSSRSYLVQSAFALRVSN